MEAKLGPPPSSDSHIRKEMQTMISNYLPCVVLCFDVLLLHVRLHFILVPALCDREAGLQHTDVNVLCEFSDPLDFNAAELC